MGKRYAFRGGVMSGEVATHYPVTVRVFVGPIEKLIKLRDKHKTEYGEIVPGSLDNAVAFVSYEQGNIGIFLNPDTDLQTVVHETVHAVWRILQYIDTALTDETNEVYAYLAGHISAHCVDILDQYKKRSKPAEQEQPKE